ncbi:MAG: recombinase family protein, partial [Epibacterium sp.]|nr:recombinase family protein [Epibacterium sp.]NQX75724.1 recombinase family protein [Epibacterium sp.]
MHNMPRAAIYARYSSDLQNETSIEDQLRNCEELCASLNADIVDTYSDREISGASLMRSGIQRLLADAARGRFDLVIAEGLDRLSRNQADIAQVHQQLRFHGVQIFTSAEGEVSELHIGLKGTMNALFLRDLAIKTHRGLKGRAVGGKSAGGKAYGYRTKAQFNSDGTPLRGDREIVAEEAEIIRRIFNDYANGQSPRKIAEALNKEGVPAPSGRNWGTSTIHGNRQRGTGILNNELYIGQQVWNRLSYRKEPMTGKRVSTLNPEEEWVRTEVPDLRIVEQELWDAVRLRQGALKLHQPSDKIWDRRRPRTLFSGLMTCGCCGGGYSKVSQSAFGCSRARNKGASVCTNKRTISQTELEARVLRALDAHLMDAPALKVFCEEYVRERNRLQQEAAGNRAVLEKRLSKVQSDHQKLVDAILDGIPATQLKDRMAELDSERQDLEQQLSQSEAPLSLVYHPSMAETYRARVTRLISELGAEAEYNE